MTPDINDNDTLKCSKHCTDVKRNDSHYPQIVLDLLLIKINEKG